MPLTSRPLAQHHTSTCSRISALLSTRMASRSHGAACGVVRLGCWRIAGRSGTEASTSSPWPPSGPGLRRSCLMSVSSEADPEGDQGRRGLNRPGDAWRLWPGIPGLDLSVWGAAAGAGSQHLSHLFYRFVELVCCRWLTARGTHGAETRVLLVGVLATRLNRIARSDTLRPVASNRAPLPGLGKKARRRAAPLVLAAGAQAAARCTARVVIST
jgi:hypothetical protein